MARDFNISQTTGFDWDTGNINKNLKKHHVVDQEAEEIFCNEPFISEDRSHSKNEERFQVLGITNKRRLLFVSFTLRKIKEELKIRIISARDMNKKEEVKYEES